MMKVGPLRDLLAALNEASGSTSEWGRNPTSAQLSERLGVPRGVLLDRLEAAYLAGLVTPAWLSPIGRWAITPAGRDLLS